jgi:uncharacterized Zn finger protein (UPF0148 family)
MTLAIRLTGIEVLTTSTSRMFPFTRPMTALIGPVGSGKSGLLMLLKHATGGEAALTPAVRAHVRSVTVHLRVGDTALALSRPVAGPGTDPVDVVDIVDPSSGTLENRLPIRPKGRPQTISEHLLTALGIPHERLPDRSRSGANAGLELNFQDLMAYLYIEAAHIDHAVAGAHNSRRDAARRAFFELAFGLSDSEIRSLRAQEASLKATIDRYRTSTKAVSDFLDRTEIPADHTASELERLYEEIARTATALAALNAGGQEDDLVSASLAAVDQAGDEEQQLRRRADQQQQIVHVRRAVVARLEFDLARADQASQADRLIDHLAFRTCPRCFQALSDDRSDGVHCPVCLQPDVTVPQTEASDDEHHRRIAAQLAEARVQLAEAVEAADHAEGEARAARLRLYGHRRHARSLTRERAVPLLDEAVDLSARRSAAQARIERIRENRAIREQLDGDREKLQSHQLQRQRISGAIRRRVEEAGQARDRVEAFDAAFRREIGLLSIPGVEEARIDSTDYLPRVNGARFGEIQASGGGVTTAVHVAYSLALLTTTLDDPNVNLPSLLILDSPRKAIGESETDLALGHRIYRRLTALADSYQHRLQLIIADNSLPSTVTPSEYSSIETITLRYGLDAMIPGLWHPGG